MKAADAHVKFDAGEASALRLDGEDPLAGFRDRFHLPRRSDGTPLVYLCGHSLGLQPKGARKAVEEELEAWARRGVAAHFEGPRPWYGAERALYEPLARLVGARPHEVTVMNGLTVNLHLLMATFFRPRGERRKVLMEEGAFPSDRYAVETHLRHRDLDPAEDILLARPRPGERTLRGDDIEELLAARGPRIALVLFAGVQYLTGQLFDLARITAAAHAHGCLVGFDLAHAVGNVPLALHDWGTDFAAWCGYKYLNAGPGAGAACFLHERHALDASLPRLGGWWGTDPEARLRMEPQFVPAPTADGWQVSDPAVLSLAPLRASLALFREAGLDALRAKSLRLTDYLLFLLDRIPAGRLEPITPRAPAEHGCQISLAARERPRELLRALEAEGFLVDFRPPDVLRVAPVPLYNSFHEVWRFAGALARACYSTGRT